MAVITDGLLGLLALVGLGALRDRYASLTGRDLAAGLAAVALEDRAGRLVAGVAMLRSAARTR